MKLFGLLSLAALRAEDDECAPANGKICDRMKNVPNKLDAVCGTDGITYSNQCLFKHYKCITGVVVNKDYKGPCNGEKGFIDDDLFHGPIIKHHCPVRCNKNRGSIVCGSDKKTYNNECEIMEKQCAHENIFFAHFGACCEGENCETYEGEALVRFSTTDLLMDVPLVEPSEEAYEVVKNEPSPEIAAYAAMVRKKLECLRGCTKENFPVCGTDGTTYPNECVLREQKCKKKPRLSVLNHGFCPQMVHNHMYDDYVEENRPDLQPEVDYDSALFQVGFGRERSMGASLGPIEPPAYDIRETLHSNTFYYQPEFEPDPVLKEMLRDSVEVEVIPVEVIEETEEVVRSEEAEPVEEEVVEEEEEEEVVEEEPEDNSSDEPITDDDEKADRAAKCSEAYPKFVDGELRKCPSDRDNYKPVCGSDNKTYYNTCLFESERCFGAGKTNMNILHDGICEGDPLKEWEDELDAPPLPLTPAPLLGRSDHKSMSKLELQKERLRKRQEYRKQKREKNNGDEAENDDEGEALIMQRGLDVKKSKKERIADRLANRVQYRRQRKQKQQQKNIEKHPDSAPINLTGRSDMLYDVSGFEAGAEAVENFEQEDELDAEINNFPELCSAIECDDFAKTSNVEMCGRIKDMATQTITEKILEFRSRCFFKRKRCHLRKKAQQIFNQNLRKFNNIIQRSEQDTIDKKEEPKFNHVGERLKRADCATGEIILKQKNIPE